MVVSPGKLALKRSSSRSVTVTVTGEDVCPVEGETVTAKIDKAGQRRIVISPASGVTDTDGQVTFTITAGKNTGIGRVAFKAGSLKKVLIVKVRK